MHSTHSSLLPDSISPVTVAVRGRRLRSAENQDPLAGGGGGNLDFRPGGNDTGGEGHEGPGGSACLPPGNLYGPPPESYVHCVRIGQKSSSGRRHMKRHQGDRTAVWNDDSYKTPRLRTGIARLGIARIGIARIDSVRLGCWRHIDVSQESRHLLLQRGRFHTVGWVLG